VLYFSKLKLVSIYFIIVFLSLFSFANFVEDEDNILLSKKVNLTIDKGFSDVQLSKLLSNGKKNYFDFIYIDGSHLGPDVLCDAVLSFRLLKVNGVMAFDDYLWPSASKSLTRVPKLAIDSFINLYSEKINIFNAPLYQIYIKKISD